MTFHSPAAARSIAPAVHGGDTEEETAAVHPDILRTHILTRLDGASLASSSCASSQFQDLCSDRALWKTICDSCWPSTADPLIADVISGFPSGHRSFVSDASSSVRVCEGGGRGGGGGGGGGGDPLFHLLRRSFSDDCLPTSLARLISAVDVHFESRPIFSRAIAIDTPTLEFAYSAFRVDLLEPREVIPPEEADIDGADLGACRSRVEHGLTLSWILIDPEANRALNVSSVTPVAVRKHWWTGHIQASFEHVIPDHSAAGGGGVLVQSWVVVEVGKRKMQVKEVGMMMEDVEGMVMTGKESLVILREAMAAERRRRGTAEEKERYESFLQLKKEGNEKLKSLEMEMKRRNKSDISLVCIATGVVMSILVSLQLFS